MDLVRPAHGGKGGDGGDGGEGGLLVVDFKTHDVDEAGARAVARDYEIQAEVYRRAAELAGPAAVRLHFTKPNVAIEMS